MAKEEGPRAFARFIEALADGDAHDQLSEELYALAKRLLEESQTRNAAVKGTLTLTLTLKADQRMVDIAYAIKRKDPAKRTSPAVMWLTDGGNLSATNPRQADLPGVIREVKARTAEAREVEGAAGAKEV